jgi:hypothetical protein
MATPKTTESTPDADTRWLEIVRQHVRSLQYGVVQIVVHDSRVTQIERTERVRLEKQPLTYEI